jgi:hypothetical protein
MKNNIFYARYTYSVSVNIFDIIKETYFLFAASFPSYSAAEL